MEEANFFCEEECIASATKFYLGKVSKRKVCERHALTVAQVLYPIDGFFFISTPQDAVLYQQRLEAVNKGRVYLERLKVKANQELQIAVEGLEASKIKALQIVMKAYETNIRRTQQLHYQMELQIEHLHQEFDNYLRSPNTEVSQVGSLLMTDDQFTPPLFLSKVIDTSLDLVEAAIRSTCLAPLPLENYLSIVLDPDLRIQEAEKLLSQTEDELRLEDFISLQTAIFKCSDSISLRYSDDTKELLTSLESRLQESLKERKECITQWLVGDVTGVSTSTSVYLKEIRRLEAAEELDKAEQTYLTAISAVQAFSCSKETAGLYSSFADFLVMRQRSGEAESYYTQALSIQQVHFPDDIETADTYEKLGDLYKTAERLEDAELSYSSALTIRAAKQPHNQQTSLGYYKLGVLYSGWKRQGEAVETLSVALSVQRVSVSDENLLICILQSLGHTLMEMNRCDEALQFLTEAIQVESCNDQLKAALYQDLASTYCRSGKYGQSEECLNSSLAIYKQISPNNLKDAEWLWVLGRSFELKERYEDADFCYDACLSVTSIEQSVVARIHFNLGNIRARNRRYGEGIQHYNAALAILVSDNPTAKLTANTYLNLGITHSKLKQQSEAEHCYRSAMNILEQIPHSLKSDILTHMNLGRIYQLSSQYDVADQEYRFVYSQLQAKAPDRMPKVQVLMYLGEICTDLGRWDEAETCFLNCLQITGSDNPKLGCVIGQLYYCLGRNCMVQQKAEEAVDYFIQVINKRPTAEDFEFLGGYIEYEYNFLEMQEDGDSNDEEFVFIQQGVINFKNYLADTYYPLGSILLDLGQDVQAEYYLTSLLRLQEEKKHEEDGYFKTLNKLKELYEASNQVENLLRLEQSQ